MSKKIKDTEYLYLSTKIRAMESRLLDRERMDRMLEAATVEDAAKVLVECGYPELSVVNVDTVDEILAQAREEVFAELSGLAPNEAMLDVFKVKYDYHNAKALLKSEALRLDPGRLLVDTGRVPPKVLEEAVQKSEFRDIPETLAAAIVQAREVLGATRDPQRSDLILDKAYFQELEHLAHESRSDFLKGYVQMLVDAANVYDENELAVRLRTMHLLYESVKNSGGTVVIPSAYSEGFADAGLDRAPDSLKSGK